MPEEGKDGIEVFNTLKQDFTVTILGGTRLLAAIQKVYEEEQARGEADTLEKGSTTRRLHYQNVKVLVFPTAQQMLEVSKMVLLGFTVKI